MIAAYALTRSILISTLIIAGVNHMDMGDGLIVLLSGFLLFGLVVKIVLIIVGVGFGLLVWTVRMMLWVKRSRDAGMRMLADPNDYRHEWED